MKTILITGATDGIGLALARLYAQQGARLILIGRRPRATLSDSLFDAATYCQADLAEESCTAAISWWLHENNIYEIDLVIHNAAIGYVGLPADQSIADLQNLIQINLWAPIALSNMLFPLVERARGKIAFISSIATAIPSPSYATYTASKLALEGFVRSWQVELAAETSPVRLQIIRPGATRTNMHRKSGADPATLRSDRFPSAESIAAKIAVALATKQRASTIGTTNQLIYHAAELSGDMLDTIMRRMVRIRSKFTTDEKKNEQRHCVITGAADGIGRALAETLAANGYRITGIDVDMERAGQVQEIIGAAGTDIQFIEADLTTLEKLPAVVEELAKRPPIDLIIHNAGISAVGPFSESNLARQRAVIDINFAAPLLLSTLLLRKGQMASNASFVFLSSLSRFTSYPGAAVYAATKDGNAGYARSLALTGIPQRQPVLTVYPGPTRTAHARRYSPDNRREKKRMPPEQLAQQIVQAIQARRHTLIPGIANRGAALLGKLMPRAAEELMVRTIYLKLQRKQ